MSDEGIGKIEFRRFIRTTSDERIDEILQYQRVGDET
jgi:hypothetical protein